MMPTNAPSEASKAPREKGIFQRSIESVKSGIKSISRGVRNSIAALLMLGITVDAAHAPSTADKPVAGEVHQEGGHAEAHGANAESHEKREVPEIKEVKGNCTNHPVGANIGLNQQQREASKVEEGDMVEVLDDHGKSLGPFKVVKGLKEYLGEPGSITANNIPAGTKVKIKKTEKGTPDEKHGADAAHESKPHDSSPQKAETGTSDEKHGADGATSHSKEKPKAENKPETEKTPQKAKPTTEEEQKPAHH